MTLQTLRPSDDQPTMMRHAIVAIATLVALLMYLDRFAIGIAAEYIREDLRMTQAQNGWFQSAFFWSYALFQVPCGLLSDRYGARRMLTIYILAWSVFTGLLGFASSVLMILSLRLLFGVAQAGAYPTAGGLIRVWFPISGRGVASSIVALGGRAGGVLAPILTAWLIIEFSRNANPASFHRTDIVNDRAFVMAFQIKDEDPQSPVVRRLVSRLPVALQTSLKDFHFSEWASEKKLVTPIEDEWFEPLIVEIAVHLRNPDLLDDVDVSRMKLVPEATALMKQRANEPLSESEVIRLNRLVIEAAFPGTIKKFRGIGWRPTMIAYGLVGLIVTLGFYVIARDLPHLHPWCNESERQLINDESTRAMQATELSNPPFPMFELLTNVSLWGNSLMQFFTNIGWLFVMITFPRYLEKVHGVSFAWQAVMTAIPTGVGIVGMYLGGWWTDLATHYVGRKWGRRVPILVTRFTAGLAYAICMILSICVTPDPSLSWLPWAYVAALCLMNFSVDMGNPAVWAYAQDVGGKYTGSVLGWANMWGNLGAAVAPPLYNVVLGETPGPMHWTLLFGACMLAFIVSGACSLVMDSTRSLCRTVENA